MRDISMRKIAKYEKYAQEISSTNQPENRLRENFENVFIKNDTTDNLYCTFYDSNKTKISNAQLGTEGLQAPNNTDSAVILTENDGKILWITKNDMLSKAQFDQTENRLNVLVSDFSDKWETRSKSSEDSSDKKIDAPQGTTLSDSSGKYYIIGPLAFEYKGMNITNKSRFRAGSSWNQAVDALNAMYAASSKSTSNGGQADTAPTAAPTTAPTTAPAAPTAPAAAPAAPTEMVDDNKVKSVLKSIFEAVLNKTLKIDISGIDFRAESKVWRGVIRGLGGADYAANKVLTEAGLDNAEKLAIQKVSVSNLNTISRQSYLSKIHNYFYGLKKKYVKSFAGMTVASEDQIEKAVKKGLGGSADKVKASERLHTLHTLSKVAARRERAKKSLDSVIEKEASVEDDMTSKIERRRAAVRAKLGL